MGTALAPATATRGFTFQLSVNEKPYGGGERRAAYDENNDIRDLHKLSPLALEFGKFAEIIQYYYGNYRRRCREPDKYRPPPASDGIDD